MSIERELLASVLRNWKAELRLLESIINVSMKAVENAEKTLAELKEEGDTDAGTS